MNPLYQKIMGGMMPQQPTQAPAPLNMMNPFQRFNFIRQAMANPAMIVKQKFPDIPDQIMNDPGQILSYLQRTRGITYQDIQNITNQFGGLTNGGR